MPAGPADLLAVDVGGEGVVDRDVEGPGPVAAVRQAGAHRHDLDVRGPAADDDRVRHEPGEQRARCE